MSQREYKTCEVCGGEFEAKGGSKHRFCSKECRADNYNAKHRKTARTNLCDPCYPNSFFEKESIRRKKRAKMPSDHPYIMSIPKE